MNILNKITEAHGWISDKDFIWWPFSFLRPERKEDMTFGLTCLMTLCFAGLSTLVYAFYAVSNGAFDPQSFVRTTALFFAAFFVWFNTITRPLWNRRARRIRLK